MTDNEIIKALEYCIIGYCDGCECRGEYLRCRDKLDTEALDLIKRQQAEIERLKTENERVKTNIYKMAIDKVLAEKARAEAIKEFAEKVKDKMVDMCYAEDAYIPYPFTFIDNLVKEMVGDSNA